MPIDPNIPLSVSMTPIVPLAQHLAQAAQQRQQAQEAQIRDLQLQAAQQQQRGDQQEQAIQRFALTPNADGVLTFDRNQLTKEYTAAGIADRLPHLLQSLDAADAASLKLKQAKLEGLAGLAYGVIREGNSPIAFDHALEYGVKNGYLSQDEAKQLMLQVGDDPGRIGDVAMQVASQVPQFAELLKTPAPKLMTVNPGDTVIDQNNPQGGAVFTAPAAAPKPAAAPEVGSFADYVTRKYGQNPTAEQITEARKVYGQADDRAVTVNVPGGGANDPKDIASAIISGDQPPTLQGLYRYGAPVRAELARQGYNLTDAMTDWTAAQKHFATLNGTQQTRLRQAVETATHSLDVIGDLADQWKGGKFPLLNRANLKLAKNGMLGPKAQSIATQLEAQISDVTSELGNVYMGGNSPTDHSLTLAAKNLSADWSNQQLKDALDLARKNLTIRANSIRNIGPIGVSGTNPYAAPAGVSTPAPDAPGKFAVTAPNNKTYTFKSQAELDAFKKQAGIK